MPRLFRVGDVVHHLESNRTWIVHGIYGTELEIKALSESRPGYVEYLRVWARDCRLASVAVDTGDSVIDSHVRARAGHAFRVGDVVEAICPPNDPYSETCDGWQGVVTRTWPQRGVGYDNSDMQVNGIDRHGHEITFDVNSQYFKLVKSEVNESENAPVASRYFDSPIMVRIAKQDDELLKGV